MKPEIKRPDDVCGAYAGRAKLSVSKLNRNTVLIEGDGISLEFLGQLILSQAKFEKDCGFQIGPKSAGKVFFTKQSPFGIYVHRTPGGEKRRMKKRI